MPPAGRPSTTISRRNGTTNPVKQGGLACRQADAAAAEIAAGFGVPVDATPEAAPLSGWLWDGRRGRSLPSGSPVPGVESGAPPPLWPVAKIGGRHLAPFLHGLVADHSRGGLPVGVPA